MQVIFRRSLSIVLVLLIACNITLGFAGLASAGDLNSARQLFDKYEAKGKNWNYGYPNDSGGIGWGEAVVMRAYLGMYEATGDKAYLDKFVFHADGVLNMRDSVRGVTDYRGLSLPAWRAGGTYNRAGKYYIYAVHTGMTAYPLAEFARMVYNNSNLSSYKAKADTYLQAAKDAVAVHKDDWVNDGELGYYIDQKGSPSNSDGVPIPFNQYLAMARAELVLYLVTGDNLYLDHVTRMAKHFKSHLKVDQSTGAYYWDYWYGLGYNGWKASDNISVNTPSYGGYKAPEDMNHGAIDIDFASMAYHAGIVFTADDIRRFGLTLEKKMLKPDGTVALHVTGANTVQDSSHPDLIGQWLRYYEYSPSIIPAFERLVAPLSAVAPGTFNAVAMLAQAYSETLDYDATPVTSPQLPPVEPPKGEIVVNGDFSQGSNGWKDNGGSIKTESNG
ncbi:MAG: hypothetical protein K6U74_12780, partial [Firmicutes bacterium]|nr:hypothetical protein [Bacillota bacterium]